MPNKFEKLIIRIFYFIKPELVIQFWRFSLSGTAATAVDIGVYLLLTRVFGIHLLLANFLSMTVGAIPAFWLNKKYTFRDTDPRVARQSAIFWLNALLMFFITEGLLWVGVYYLKLWDILAKIAIYVLIYLLNFFLQRVWIFRKRTS
jgi:putative flippase GtrA